MGTVCKLARTAALSAILLLVLLSLAACGPSEGQKGSSEPIDTEGFSPVRIGTMPTEDFLPMWVAEKEGLFGDAGVDVETITFDSAQTLSSAIAAGEVDMAMVDVMRAVKLNESGTPVDIEWVTLGAESDQGIFGVLAPADAGYSTLSEFAEAVEAGDDLANKGIGLAANTVPEYVFDQLSAQAGIDPDSIPAEEVASLPERYSLLASGNLGAAALPASLLELGKANGMILLADDSERENISQSVMVARNGFAEDDPDAIMRVAAAWDAAVEMIDADPGAYMQLLAEKANLNESIVGSYQIGDYPLAMSEDGLVRIDAALVAPQIEWMAAKGYSTATVTYDPETGRFSIG